MTHYLLFYNKTDETLQTVKDTPSLKNKNKLKHRNVNKGRSNVTVKVLYLIAKLKYLT